MNNLGGVFIVILLVLLLGTAYFDIKESRIPNSFILIGLITGILYRLIVLNEKDYLLLILGIVLPIVIFSPLFLIRAMGAGDIKLMAVTGTFLGISDNVKCMILAIFIGGIMAVMKLLIHKNVKERFRYGFLYFKTMWLTAAGGGDWSMPYISKSDADMTKKAGIHFAIPLLLAAMIVTGGGI